MDITNEPLTPTTDESQPGTSIEKFKTADERDKAYLELEKFSHTQSQRLADLERKFDSLPVPQQNQGQDNRQFTDLYPGQQAMNDRETQLASRLLTRPSEVLREVAEATRAQTMREVQVHMANERLVADFRRDNPDLAKHEDLVTMFVRRQDEKLNPQERLKKAIPEARAYLASIAKGNNQSAPVSLDPNTFVEAPASRDGAPAAAAVQAPVSEEDELSEMIRERSARQQKKMFRG